MILRYNDTGEDVEALQQQLVDIGYLTKLRLIDEVPTYDRLVDTTIRRIQRDAGIKVDGIYGPDTAQAIEGLGSYAAASLRDICPLDAMPNPEEIGDGWGVRAGWPVLRTALHFMERGARELGKNNRGGFVQHFFEAAGSPGHGDWCAAFVSTCAIQAIGRRRMPLKPAVWVTALYVRALGAGIFRYTPQGAALVEAVTGEAVDPALIDEDVDLRPGDACIEMHWTIDQPQRWKTWKGYVIPGHTYLVHHKEQEALYYYTIEGNLGAYPAYVGPFMRRTDDGDLLGYIRWDLGDS